jgi:ADP-heptose:LPS heptosyltransferase
MRSDDEVWTFNVPDRYILNNCHVEHLEEHVETVSSLKGSSYYKPMIGNVNLAKARILIERQRERGIGDMLFMTGPMAYFQHISGNSVKSYFYALSDRAAVLAGHPHIATGKPMVGPLNYDSIRQFDYHWFVNQGTEYNEEADQPNVYDSLYLQLGIDPTSVDAVYKRPSASLDKDDWQNLDNFFYFCWMERKFDLRKTGYYVVAPFSNASIRSMPYKTWLSIIAELSKRRPTVVVGTLNGRLPEMDISAGEFYQSLSGIGPNVINLIGSTPIRVIMAIVSKAVCTFSLDSGILYVSQALRTPAISFWGPHHPGVRIGYDQDYMDLAIWNKDACRCSPCFAYAGFPEKKCPLGPEQSVCEVLKTVGVDQAFEKLAQVESKKISGPMIFRPATV